MQTNKKSFSILICSALLPGLLTGCATEGEELVSDTAQQASRMAMMVDSQEEAASNAAKEIENHSFLDMIQGHWAGTCDLIWPGYPYALLEIEMERIVKPTEDPNRYTYQIIYRDGDFEQLRDYSLVVVDETWGHYQIDENNGIIIDHYYYTPGIVVEVFDVAGVRIMQHETLTPHRSELQLITSGLTPQTVSGAGDFVVNSYPFRTNQKCSLRKVKYPPQRD